jgi:hypothetical protein
VYGVYIYILYKSSLKFDHYYFITDGSLCLLYYSIHSNATITMSMVWLNFDLLLFHKKKKLSSIHNHCIKFFVNCSARKGSLIGNKNICICICIHPGCCRVMYIVLLFYYSYYSYYYYSSTHFGPLYFSEMIWSIFMKPCSICHVKLCCKVLIFSKWLPS